MGGEESERCREEKGCERQGGPKRTQAPRPSRSSPSSCQLLPLLRAGTQHTRVPSGLSADRQLLPMASARWALLQVIWLLGSK